MNRVDEDEENDDDNDDEDDNDNNDDEEEEEEGLSIHGRPKRPTDDETGASTGSKRSRGK